MPRPGSIPYAPDSRDRYDYEPGSRITDLILRAGDIRAQGSAQRGQMIGDTIAGLGQAAGQYLGERDERERARAAKAAEGQFITAATGEGFDINAALQNMAPEHRPQALALYSKLEDAKAQRDQRLQTAQKAKAEIEKLEAEAQEQDDYRNAIGASILLGALGTPEEQGARQAVLGYFGQEQPEMIEQLSQLPGEQLRPVLERFIQGSGKFLEEQGKREESAFERSYKEGEARRAEVQVQLAGKKFAHEQDVDAAKLALDRAKLAEEKRQADLAAGGGEETDAAFLLQGGTADKVPIKGRARAVAAARESGGVDGTGFVPASQQQLMKYSDFMDLRSKAQRLKTLLTDPEVSENLGPVAGGFTEFRKELPLIGASTKVKEAFDLMKDLSDAELRKRSGAQISPGEYQRITGFTVSSRKQPDSNLTNLERMTRIIEEDLGRLGAVKLPEPPEPVTGGEVLSNDPDAGEPLG